MRAITSFAIAAMFMWIPGFANAQQKSNRTENNQAQGAPVENGAFGQGKREGSRGQSRRGRRGGKQGQNQQGQGMQRGGRGQQGQQGRRGGAQMLDFIFSRFDKDKNGSLSQSEAPDRMKQRFDMLDTNGDKSVSKEEMQAAFEKMGQGGKGQGKNGAGKAQGGKGKGKGQSGNGAGKGQGQAKGQGQGKRGGKSVDPAKMMQYLDKNKDGVLSVDEVPEKMKGRFDRLDGDSSGTITVEELKRTFDKMKNGQLGRDKSADPEATKPIKPKRPPTKGGA